ncbi:LysM peptidoglycan-binding domain-containing protein [Staphylospora marina]|uniref:LysM peptidoglycan-binding domain-containing protein n=1 Tax=Staphylospora marina TaxID=2490858 RepID=UPI000F5BB537|nr:LysM domain-containing protein [Staphylospora marina]
MKIHVTRAGDTLWGLAQKYNVPAERLKEANPELGEFDQLRPGLKVRVPTGKVPVTSPGSAEDASQQPEPASATGDHPKSARDERPYDSSDLRPYDSSDLDVEDWESPDLDYESSGDWEAAPMISAQPPMPWMWPPHPGWWTPAPPVMPDHASWPTLSGGPCSGFVPYHPHSYVQGWPAPWAGWPASGDISWKVKESSSREG